MYISENIKHKMHHILAGVILIAGTQGVFYSVKTYPQVFNVVAKIESEREVSPKQEIKIEFSEPMLPSQVNSSIKIVPQTEVDFHWEDSNRKLIITPAKFWNLEQTYQISIFKAKSIMLTEISTELSFTTVRYPKVVNFYPASGTKDVILDIEDPIIATFDKPIDDFRVKFIIQPFQDLAYQIDSEKKEVKLISKNELERGKKYDITALIRYKEAPEEDNRKIYTTSFETKPLPPTTWENDFALRLEQAKRFTDPKISQGKYIDINLKSQIMTIFENGKLLDAYMVSTGKASLPTPQGTFHIANKSPRAWSKKYGLFMPFWMAVASDGSFGIHELPEWPSGYKEGQNHLGTPVSHGCIRLGIGPAERVYNWTDIGTTVVIHV